MDLFTLTIVFRTPNMNVRLHFKDHKRANDVYDSLADATGIAEIIDDYGSMVRADVKDIMACAISDIDRELEAQSEVSFKQAKAQARVQTRAQADPVFRGPALAGNGMRFPQ